MENWILNLAHFITSWLLSLGLNALGADLILLVLQWSAIVMIVTLNVIVLIWLERKVAGFMQQRLGPNRIGPYGMFQTIADTLKLLTKEDIVPSQTDKWIFKTAPMFFIIVAVMLYLVLPMGQNMAVLDLNVGLFYFISVGSLST
ncbi:MAG: NADH-quinone oxidoreductase subunit H, partial [Firmicutes bacterium]|nr:NADH-quinone oxidoreductase subunit H [Bacillota bacterium]